MPHIANAVNMRYFCFCKNVHESNARHRWPVKWGLVAPRELGLNIPASAGDNRARNLCKGRPVMTLAFNAAFREASVEAAKISFDRDLVAEIAGLVARSVLAEREACAKIADERAAVCRAAYDAGDVTEVHPLNEALHIAQLIRNKQ